MQCHKTKLIIYFYILCNSFIESLTANSQTEGRSEENNSPNSSMECSKFPFTFLLRCQQITYPIKAILIQMPTLLLSLMLSAPGHLQLVPWTAYLLACLHHHHLLHPT